MQAYLEAHAHPQNETYNTCKSEKHIFIVKFCRIFVNTFLKGEQGSPHTKSYSYVVPHT